MDKSLVKTIVAFACLLPLAAGCAPAASSFGTSAPSVWENRENVDVMVQVENQHYDVVRVDAVWERMEYFLGEVGPGSTRTFRLPGHMLATFGQPRLRANPRGSANELLSSPVKCQHARAVEWRLKRNLHPSRPFVTGF